MTLPPADKMQVYIETARNQQQQRRLMLCQRQERGLEVARQAAQILKETFGVSRVVVFGSLLSEDTFHESSDLDLAVWDLPSEMYLKAVARLMQLPEFSIDLVQAELASPYLQTAIAQGLPV